MKILHIAPIGHHAEGIGTVLQKLVPLQMALGNDVCIISPFVNVTYQELPISTIINRNDFDRFFEVWYPDIVIFHSVFNLKYVKYYRVLSKRNIPYMIQLHGALSYQNYNKNKFKKKVALLLWIKSFIKHAESIIYLNEVEYKNSIVPKFNPKYSIIPNGCDSQLNIDLTPKARDIVNIVFIGRIAYMHKGIDLLLDALKILEGRKRNTPCFHLTFYGNEDDIDACRLRNDVAIFQNASYGGGLYGEKKDKILRSSDIFILTSRYEGMPMGVLEAWSYGIPCILTEGTNMTCPDILENAYWKTELDSSKICETILFAIDQYKKSPFSYREAALKESKKYNWNTIASKTIDVYRGIIYNLSRN